MNTLANYYEDKTILVTGGVGSIGSELVKKLLEFNPKSIRILDNNESGLFHLDHKLNSDTLRFFVGDIRDKERLRLAIHDVDVVFHAAALKHVPLCEYNPFEAIKTNVLGTQNLIDVSLEENVQKLITISTDKAVNPTSVMGATKLLAERLTISANYYKGFKKTCFSTVRFGNVLYTNGSVIPLFKNQISKGGPITITHKDMTRFMMSIENAVKLVLKAASIARGEEIFILKMPTLKIEELADVMIEELSSLFGFMPNQIKKEYIGMRPGEKLFEELMTEEESKYTYENSEMYIVIPNDLIKRDELFEVPQSFFKTINKEYTSNSNVFLSKNEIKTLIKNLELI